MTAFKTRLLLASLALSGPVLAQDCDVLISRGEIDYGQLNRTTLKAVAGEVSLAPRTLNLTVQCAQVQPLQVSYRGLAADARSYRLGEQGQYQLWFSDAQVDGAPVALGQVQGAGLGVTGNGREMALLPEHALVPLLAGQPAEGQRLTARVQVRSRGPEAALYSPQASEWLAQGSFVSGAGERALTLRAGFTPASCTPRLGQGGAVDFGAISVRRLSDEHSTLLQRSLALTVQCDGPTRFALVAQDNRAGSARVEAGQDGATLFGIGVARSGMAIGGYQLRVANPVADVPLLPLYGAATGLDWSRVAQDTGALHHNGQLLGFAREGEGALAPAALTDFNAQLQVDLHLAPTRALPLDQEIPIQGSATLEIIYL